MMNALAIALFAILPIAADARLPDPGIPAPGSIHRTPDGYGGWWYVVDYRSLTSQQKRCFPSVWRAEYEGTLLRPNPLNPSITVRVFVHENAAGNIVPNWYDNDAYYDAIIHDPLIFGPIP